MPEESYRWIVDVLDTHSATVEVEGERMVALPRWLLPADAREGDVLTVRHDRQGRESRLVIALDDTAAESEREASSAQLASAPPPSTGDVAL
jgi:hypothetical protein